jgi:excisionase family DNA binding protein
MTTAYIPGPAAVVNGTGAFLLSRLLRSPQVAGYIRDNVWLHGPDFNRVIAAIHAAGRAWESTVDLPQRDSVRVRMHPPTISGTLNIEAAALILGVSIRRTQELASKGTIRGRRVGRRWQLDTTSVHAHHHHRRGHRAKT